MANDKKKRKKSVAEFFSTLNTNKSEAKPTPAGEVITNPKSKVVKWVLGGTVLTLSTVGIAVPWSLSSWSVIEKKPLNNSDIMYEIKIGNVVHKITYKDFEDRTNAFVSRDNQKIIDLTNAFNASVIRNLYDEEHDAYLKFKAIIDQKNKDLKISETVGPETYGYDVSKPSAKIAEEQSKNLYDAKKNFQTTLGRNWPDKWLSELKTNPIYGFQDLKDQTGLNLEQIEKKAIEFMTTTALKKPALARFEAAEIVTDKWTTRDLDAWHHNDSDQNVVEYYDSQNVLRKLSGKEVNTFMTTILDRTKNAKTLDNPSPGTLTKLAVFQTKSYLPEFRRPNELLENILPNFFNTAVISSVDLAIKPGEANLSAFTFDKSVITNLFKITSDPSSPLLKTNEFAAILQLSKFRGAALTPTGSAPFASDPNQANSQLKMNQARDEQLIINLSGSASEETPQDGEETTPPVNEAAKTLGSSKFKTFGDLLAAGEEGSEANRWANVVALGSDSTLFTNKPFSTTTVNQTSLFKPQDTNPFNIFLKLLLSIEDQKRNPNFDVLKSNSQPAKNLDKLKSFWEKIEGGEGASYQVLQFVNLVKKAFVVKTKAGTASDFDSQNDVLTSVNTVLPPSYNTTLQNIVDGFSEGDIAFIGKLLAVSFADPNARVNNVPGIGIVPITPPGSTPSDDIYDYNKAAGFWSLYKLSDTTFLHLNSDGMKIFTIETFNEKTATGKFDQMIMSDLDRSLDEKTSSLLLYDVKNIYEKISKEEITNYVLLKDEQTINPFKSTATNQESKNILLFKYKIAQELGKDVGEFDNGNFWDNLSPSDQNDINNEVNFFNNFVDANLSILLADEENKSLDKITELLTTNVEKKKYYEFATIQDLTSKQTDLYWQFDPSNPYTPKNVASNPILNDYLGMSNIETRFIEKYLELVKPKLKF